MRFCGAFNTISGHSSGIWVQFLVLSENLGFGAAWGNWVCHKAVAQTDTSPGHLDSPIINVVVVVLHWIKA